MDEALAGRVATLVAAVDALLSEDLISVSDDAVLAAARAVETARRRLETFDHPLVAELIHQFVFDDCTSSRPLGKP